MLQIRPPWFSAAMVWLAFLQYTRENNRVLEASASAMKSVRRSSPPEFLPLNERLPTPSHCAISTASTAIPANTAGNHGGQAKGRGDRRKVAKPLTRPSTRLDHTPHVASNAQDHALPGSKKAHAK